MRDLWHDRCTLIDDMSIISKKIEIDEKSIEACLKAARILAVLTMLIGAAGLAGWIGDIQVLARPSPWLSPMSTITALLLCFSAIALALLSFSVGGARAGIAFFLGALIVVHRRVKPRRPLVGRSPAIRSMVPRQEPRRRAPERTEPHVARVVVVLHAFRSGGLPGGPPGPNAGQRQPRESLPGESSSLSSPSSGTSTASHRSSRSRTSTR